MSPINNTTNRAPLSPMPSPTRGQSGQNVGQNLGQNGQNLGQNGPNRQNLGQNEFYSHDPGLQRMWGVALQVSVCECMYVACVSLCECMYVACVSVCVHMWGVALQVSMTYATVLNVPFL